MGYYNLCDNQRDFGVLVGKTLTEIRGGVGDDEMTFVATDGSEYKLYHDQSCCESVNVHDICGDVSDLLGSPILQAEEATSDKRPDDLPDEDYEPESQTWTFYRLATIKGSVTIRWHGTSNGYYSESVSFAEAVAPRQEVAQP